MKKLFIIGTLLASLSSNASLIKDTLPNSVVLKPAQAVGVIRDLIRYDGTKEIVKLLQENQVNYLALINEKNMVIASQQGVINRNELVISNLQALNKSADIRAIGLEKALRKQVRVGRFTIVLAAGAIALAAWQVIK